MLLPSLTVSAHSLYADYAHVVTRKMACVVELADNEKRKVCYK